MRNGLTLFFQGNAKHALYNQCIVARLWMREFVSENKHMFFHIYLYGRDKSSQVMYTAKPITDNTYLMSDRLFKPYYECSRISRLQ
jgi:hypothetical protein